MSAPLSLTSTRVSLGQHTFIHAYLLGALQGLQMTCDDSRLFKRVDACNGIDMISQVMHTSRGQGLCAHAAIDVCAANCKHCALAAQERVKDWQSRFQHLSLECKELTGDTGVVDVHELDNADIICTTPEKFGTMMLFIAANPSAGHMHEL